MGAVRHIVGKDLSLRLRDRSVFLWGLVAPLVLAFVFDLVFGSVFSGTERADPIAMGMVLSDRGEVGTGFAEQVDALADDGLVTVEVFEDEDRLRSSIDDGLVEAGWVIPDGLTGSVRSGAPGTITVVSAGGVAGAVAQAVAERFSVGVQTVSVAIGAGVRLGSVDPLAMDSSIREAAALATVIRTRDDTAATRQLDSGTFFAAGLGIYFMFFLAGMGTTSMLEERGEGTLRRLLAAPIPPWRILVAKAAASVVVSVVSLIVLVTASTLLMGADWGEPVGVILVIGSAVLAAVAVMTVVGAFAHSAEHSGNLQAIVATVFALLGGTFVPVPQDGVLSWVARVTPNFWVLRGLSEMAGGGTEAALPAVAVLASMAALVALVGMPLVARTVRA